MKNMITVRVMIGKRGFVLIVIESIYIDGYFFTFIDFILFVSLILSSLYAQLFIKVILISLRNMYKLGLETWGVQIS